MLTVFLVLNPVSGMDGRAWAEVILAYAGTAAAVVALATPSLPIAVCCLWLVVVAAMHPSAGAFSAVLLMLGFLGIFKLSATVGGAVIIRAALALNILVMGLQVAGVWGPLLQVVFPAAQVTVFNTMHPITGLTSSTGDLACVLAIGIPFLTVGRWRYLLIPAIAALCSTSALSGIVAGLAGLLIIGSPWIKQRMPVGVAVAGVLFAGSSFLMRKELLDAWQDERWQVWGAALAKWMQTNLMFGCGLTSWNSANMAVVEGDQVRVWNQLHFDLLQLGYEAGLVGVVLALGAWVMVVRKLSVTANLVPLGAIVAIGVCQFGHFPFHLAAPSAVAALALGEAYHV